MVGFVGRGGVWDSWPMHFVRGRALVVPCAVVALMVLAGCSGGAAVIAEPSTVSVPSMALSPTGSVRSVSIDTSLTSIDKVIAKVGPQGEAVYGWNRLTGVTKLEGKSGTFEMLGNVHYVKGAGELGGFLTVTTANGSTLAMRFDGQATASADGASTSFDSGITVIGGTKDYVNASGTGHWAGSRSAELGGAVQFHAIVQLSS